MKNLYIHVGTPKTGTTAIQSFLLDNKDVFSKKGYCYSLMPFYYYSKASRRRNAHFILEKVRDENGVVDVEATNEYVESGYKAVGQWLEATDNVILTDESLWSYMRNENWVLFERFLDIAKEHGAQVKVIVYLRRQDEYMASWWKQHVREGGIKAEWEEFVKKPSKLLNLNYAKQLKMFSDYVGIENVIVRRYEKDRFVGGNIYSDFLNAIGLEMTEEFTIVQEKVHGSLDNNYAEIMRVLNTFVKQDIYNDINIPAYFAKSGIDCSELNRKTEKTSMLSTKDQQKIWSKYQKSNNEVLSRYFPGEDILFDCKENAYEKWKKDNDNMVDDIMLFFGSLALRQQQENEILRRQIVDLSNRITEQEKRLMEEQKYSRFFLSPIKYLWKILHFIKLKVKK